MYEIIVPETGLPLKFPDPRKEAAARAREFAALSSDTRFRQIIEMMAFGLCMTHSSPRRAWIESHWETQEADFQRFQRDLFERHAV